MAAYRRSGAEWGVRLPADPARWGLPPAGRYAVLHVRESDKLGQHGVAGYQPAQAGGKAGDGRCVGSMCVHPRSRFVGSGRGPEGMDGTGAG